jgi:hypothetical protein
MNGLTRTPKHPGGGIRCLGEVSILCWPVTPAMTPVPLSWMQSYTLSKSECLVRSNYCQHMAWWKFVIMNHTFRVFTFFQNGQIANILIESTDLTILTSFLSVVLILFYIREVISLYARVCIADLIHELFIAYSKIYMIIYELFIVYNKIYMADVYHL